MANALYYGDNLDVLRRKIRSETVDLCYIDPPFNSKRNYNQIYNRIGNEDRAQAQAFTDTWVWDEHAISGHQEILANDQGRFQAQLVDLIKGLRAVLGEGSLFAYLVSMSLRITEINRVLKRTGTLFLHCDSTAGHYLKLVLAAVFCPQGGDYINEIVWCYSQGGRSKSCFPRKHDTIFWYAKGPTWQFNGDDIRVKYELLSEKSSSSFTKTDEEGRKFKAVYGPGKKKLYTYYEDEGKVPYDWWTDIHQMTGRTAASGNEYLGYPTQKPEALLERIIKAASNEGDMVIFQVKSGGVKRGDIATLRGDMERESAALACLITLEDPSGPMRAEAKAAGQYNHESMGRSYDRISIVTIKEIVGDGKRLEIPMSLEVLAAASRAAESKQIDLL